MKLRSAWIALALVHPLACGGRRSNPALSPSSTAYRLCEFDLHCPAGSYCSAGVCDVDCHVDGDCHSGEGCDLRGRCHLPDVHAAPPRFAGHLVAPVPRLALSPEAPTATLTLGNDGAEAIGRFHVVSDDPGLSATPSSGTLAPGATAQISVRAGAGWTGPAATLHLLSTGGSADVAVRLESALAGRLVGQLSVEAPFALGVAPFALELVGSPAKLTGAVDGAASLLWPLDAAATGSDDGTNFQVSFAFIAAPGTPGNPLLDVPVRRSVSLSGKHDGPSSASGSYLETVDGLPGGPLLLSGSFSLHRAAAPTGLKAQVAAAFSPVAPGALPPPCACTDPGCPSSAGSGAAGWFFDQGFPFERWASGMSYASGSCLQPNGDSGPCVVPAEAACALADFASLGAAGAAGLLDTLRAQASLSLLAGKDGLAKVLQPVGPAFGAAAISQEVQSLEAAASLLGQGLHAAPGGGGLFAAANFALARGLPASAFSQPSRDGAFPGDVPRFGGAIAARLFAEAEAADRLERTFDSQGLLALAQPAASAALLDLAALGALVEPSGQGAVATYADPIAGLGEAFAPLADAFERQRLGLNPAGYQSSYVPFAYDPEHPDEDLFQQLLPLAERYLAAAQADEQRLVTDSREFDHDATQLATELSSVAQKCADEVVDLCGPVADPMSAQGCGAKGGKIQGAEDDARAASEALSEASSRLSSATAKVTLLQQQARVEMADETAEISAVTADGKVIEVADTLRATQQEANDAMGCANGLVQSLQSIALAAFGVPSAGGIPGASCGPLLSDVAFKSVAETAKADEARTDSQVQYLVAQQKLHDDQLEAEIADAASEARTAGLEVQRQTALFDSALERERGLVTRLHRALHDEAETVGQAATQATADPTYRLYRDADAVQWAADMEVARKWIFLATRALEYTIDASFARGGELFQDESAQALSGYVGALQDAHDTDQLANGWDQERDDLVSLRADVFGLTQVRVDPVTGESLTPSKQFQALLALPTQRDPATGNLRIRFATSVRPNNGIFSADVAGDRIAGLKIGLVGSQLAGRTAYVSLTQAGETELRAPDGSIVPYQLEPKVALVPSGINPATFEDPALPESTDLFERPVAAKSWTLGLDQLGDPRNAAVDVGALEDIEIWVHHRGRSMQP